jgi:thioredoxin reductase (NADPH)
VSREPLAVLIVGGGPAGLTAGIYAARSGHKTLILEKGLPGGQVARTTEVENYPGFAEPLVAMELAQAMESQARKQGCEIETLEATRLRRVGPDLEVETSGGTMRPGSVIIASGVESKEMDLPGERELRGRGISYCAICDGPLFRGKEVAVVGGGDSALDEALYLSGICSKVHLIHRRDELRGCALAQERLRRKENVRLVLSSVITAIQGQARLEALEITSRKDDSKTLLPVSGLFIYVGSTPNTAWCRGVVDQDETGFVKTDPLLRTNVPGVFAAGDVRVTPLRQIATAVGDGALAAMTAHRFLTER